MCSWDRVEVWQHSYVVSALPHVTLPCPLLSCHVRYFTGTCKNNGKCTGSWLPVTLPKFYGLFYGAGADSLAFFPIRYDFSFSGLYADGFEILSISNLYYFTL